MGIGSITSTSSMSGMQMTSAGLKDQKSKNIQNEITDVQQQMQKLSSKEDLSANEKANEKKKLQKEISSLNTELKQHQEELQRSQRREIMLAELQEDKKPAKEAEVKDKVQIAETPSDQSDENITPADRQQTGQSGTVIVSNSDGTVILKEAVEQNADSGVDTEKHQTDEVKEEVTAEKEPKTNDSDMDTDAGLSHKEMHAMVSADTSAQQADRLGTIIAKTNDGIAILKGEISQDERRGVDTERKQAELEKMEKREERATAFQFSILGSAGNTMKAAPETNVSGINDSAQSDAENNAYISAMKISQEEQAQQRFYVSFG